ncbi:hypothetical protein XAC3218_470004 [Xanthomonas citri pv. citri]|nr:hypothetical protein XAC3218_470004 [Xanthomonas citri pv. citri]CEH80313.1 hypothetical protein XACG117_1000004 [Xanthomonas citri pv. citri]
MMLTSGDNYLDLRQQISLREAGENHSSPE